MAKTSDELLNQCLEIEGLLALISKREDNTPQMVYEMLRAKTAELNASVSEICAGVGDITVADRHECDSDDCKAIAEAVEIEETEDADVSEPVEDSYRPAEFPTDDSSTADEAGAEDVEVEFFYDEDTPEAVETVDEMEPVVVDYEPAVAEDVAESFEADPEFSSQIMETPAPASQPVHPETEPLPADEEEDDVTPVLSDKFAEFTLNDKFRFRRELFGNSDIDMNEALDVVNAMSSREEVEDYFYNDMCWDPSNEDVKDFIRIVTAKFNN